MRGRSIRRALPLALAAALGSTRLAAQQPSVSSPAATGTATVTPGPEYRAGSLKRRLLGENYRDAWTTPITVPVLDLRAFAGGLTPTRTGGGNQTKSLRFLGADGRTYAFRSVNKDVTRSLPVDLQNTLVDRAIQDQTRAQLPGSVLAVQLLEEAAGVLHTTARLYVMPDDPALGEFRPQFAGMLGALEERPGDGDRPQPFAGSTHVADTEAMEAALLGDPAERLEVRDYLNVRLFDLFINDWDRHEDQYDWARYDRPGGGHVWRAIPRDRDWAVDDFDGLLMPAARAFTPKLVRLGPAYPENLTGLVINAQFLDRRLLGELPRPAWDSAAGALQARLTDAAIDSAVAALPAEYRARYGAFLTERLRGRRDHLPEVARRLYALLAREAEVHATRRADFAQAVRYPDGSLDVQLFARQGRSGAGEPYFRRRFVPGETDEVRLFLHGGGDHFMARGLGSGIRVRVVADSGADFIENTGRGPVTVYTTEAADTVVAGTGISINRHSWAAPEWKRGDPAAKVPRDWGRKSALLAPTAGWRSGAGLVIGVGPSWKRWGFRRDPYAWSQSLKALVAPQYGRFGLEYRGDFHVESVRTSIGVLARASDLEVERFYGLGNDSPAPDEHDLNWERALLAQARLNLPLARRLFLSAGPVAKWLDPSPARGGTLDLQRPRGADAFGAAGAGADLVLGLRDSTGYPSNTVVGRIGATGYPLASGGGVGAYGDAHGLVQAYLTPGGRWTPTLALRAGGQRVWGGFPFQDAASVGGWTTLRGWDTRRLQGDAAAWGGAELRVPVVRANLGVRGDLGVLGLTDAGRVWMDGESPGGWRTGYGGGLWFSFLDRTRTASLVWAQGERGRLYAHFAIPF
jgi:hypothetical protein